ncbi:MAG: hypothetical protein ACRDG4_21525, partial [Chloroflexota bacterium]
MAHLKDGVLRRLCDDPLALTAPAREHVRDCAICRSRYDRIADTARVAASFLTVPVGTPATGRAFVGVRARLGPARRNTSAAERLSLALYPRKARLRVSATISTLAAVLLATLLALTPVGSFASGFFTIFQVRQFTPVQVTLSDLTALPNLTNYGTMHMSKGTGSRTVAGSAEAAAIAHQAVLVPGRLPDDVPSAVTYLVTQPAMATFTFSAAKARSSASRLGKVLPPMPASLNGSSLNITIGPAVLADYGSTRGIPTLLLAQAPDPRVTATGATTRTIINYLLAQPGISPQLAAQIRAIGDPSTTLPIPIPVNFAQGKSIQVRGVQGVAVGDNTGIGSAVIWTEHGLV